MDERTNKREVNLKILNRQFTENLEPKGQAFERKLKLEDEIEVQVGGTMYRKGNATYITYEEDADRGLESTRTMIRLKDGTLKIKHYGDEDASRMDLRLEEGVMNITRFVLPVASLDLEVYTNKLKDELDEEGFGRIFADYSVKFDKFANRRHKLDIEVKPS